MLSEFLGRLLSKFGGELTKEKIFIIIFGTRMSEF